MYATVLSTSNISNPKSMMSTVASVMTLVTEEITTPASYKIFFQEQVDPVGLGAIKMTG